MPSEVSRVDVAGAAPPSDSGWRLCELGDVASEVTVGHVGPMAREYVADGIPFLRSRDVEPFHIRTEGVMYVSREFHGKLRKSSLAPGDVVIVRTGKPGAAAVVPASLPVANCADLVIVRPGPEIDARFLAYYINSAARGYVSAHLVGGVQQHFNVASAKKLKLRLPPMAEQRRIAGVLASLDRKVEQNAKVSRGITEIVQLSYRKLIGGVEKIRFPEFFEVISGGTPKTSVAEYWGGEVPWFSAIDAPAANTHFVVDTDRTITQHGLEQSAATLVPEETTLLTARGTVGKVAVAGVPLAFNQSCYGIQPRDQRSSYFTYFTVGSLVDELRLRSHGSVFETITRATLNDLTIPKPQDAALVRFEELASPLMLQIRAGLLVNRRLDGIRDTLLPKLVSGRLRVPETYDPENVLGQLVEKAAATA